MDKLIEAIVEFKSKGIKLATIVKMVKDIYFDLNKTNESRGVVNKNEQI